MNALLYTRFFPATARARSHPGLVQQYPAPAYPGQAAPAQAPLTEAEINSAIRYNQARYNAQSTKLIQDLVGAVHTGIWDRQTVEHVADFQDKHGKKIDGMVGSETFELLENEQTARGIGTETENSLLLFRTPAGNVMPRYVRNAVGSHIIQGHFDFEARFSARGNCGDWEYRQEIRGNAWAQRPGSPRVNLNHHFNLLPHGSLDPTWKEDGNTTWAGINYGHRAQPGRAANPINRYEDTNGAPDQLGGCVYKGEDSPAVTDAALISGDLLTLELEFAGGVYRRNAGTGRLDVVTRQTWTVNGTVPVP
ncbi:MAG TPA: peptidoglycan-binding domain-containing protein [Candidatus Binatia bacterium]